MQHLYLAPLTGRLRYRNSPGQPILKWERQNTRVCTAQDGLTCARQKASYRIHITLKKMKNCDNCKYYCWYYDKCLKWNCEVDAREIHNCFEPNDTIGIKSIINK